MSANNSISKLLEQFIELYNNSLATFEKTNEAITTDKETVTIDLYDPATGTTSTRSVPSFGYLMSEVKRLSNNVSTLTGANDASSNVRLADGSFRKVYTSKLKGPAPTINSISAPTGFETKENEFFEDFLNPLLKVKFDLTGQIPVNTEQAYIERYVFKGDDAATVSAFDTLYKNNSEINYDTFKTELTNNGYKYFLDKQVVEMPVRSVQYYGYFDVISIDNAEVTRIVDGVSQTKTVRLFTLNKLTYTDSSKALKETETIKVGDSVVVNTGKFSTRYKIDAINTDTLQVELSLIEGFEAIRVDVNALSIYKDVDTEVALEINVSFDERQIIFAKAVDPDSKVQSELFSPGAGFYSNELQILLTSGETMTLAEYYKKEVADFGQFIKSLKVDSIPPASVGIVPNQPVLDTANFKVVQINKHLTDNDATNKIVKLKSEKATIEQNIKKIDSSLGDTRSLVNTKKYASKVEADKDKSQLNSLLSSRKAEADAYSSVVTEIATLASSNNLANVSPKYRVRGFWSLPEAKALNDSAPQEVVQFKIRYRYQSTNGSTSQIDQIKFQDGTTAKTAAFSNWVEVPGPIRKRLLDPSTGKYYWKVENEEDSQEINFNSLDISIQPGEVVEVMIKSVSEAGFPSTPIESDWSSIIAIPFPDGEIPVENLTDIVKENSLETIRVKINNDLTAVGVYSHVADSFNINDKYFAHTAQTIASGFLTTEQNPVTVYDKLVEMQQEIERLTAKLAGTLGELQVYIEDEDGNITTVSNNSTAKLFAGYYVDEVNSLAGTKKGSIITKVFKLKLANSKASQLELVSRLVGDYDSPAHVSTTLTRFGRGTGTIDTAIASDTYYTNEGRYDLVPIQYQNAPSVNASTPWFGQIPFQSSQMKGQYVYSRFKNIANDDSLYVTSPIDAGTSFDTTGIDDYEYGLSYNMTYTSGNNPVVNVNRVYTSAAGVPYATTSGSNDFIWSGGYSPSYLPLTTSLDGTGMPTSTKYDNGIFVHKNHPILNPITKTAATTFDIPELQSSGIIGIPKTATRRVNMDSGLQQTAYRTATWTNFGGVVVSRPIKMSFDTNDVYLLGGRSCGSFLFMAPLEQKSLLVDSKNKFGVARVDSGASKALSIDLIFQYRMTDYYGDDNSTGRVGGIVTTSLSNITYSKKIGIDILDANKNEFQFDVEVYAKYKTEGSSVTNITKSMLTNFNAGGGGGGFYHKWLERDNLSQPSEFTFYTNYIQ
jgi:hypothetical protein